MWPTKAVAEVVLNFANLGLIVSLAVGVVATILVVWMGNVKEGYLRLELAASAERVAAAELKTEQLRRDLGPRRLQRAAFIAALKDQPRAPVEIMYLRDDPECFDLAQQISGALIEAGWEVTGRIPIPDNPSASGSPTAMGVNGQPSGVTVVVREFSGAEALASQNRMMGNAWVRTPWTVLTAAMEAGLGQSKSAAGGANSPPLDKLRVVVAPR